jgi:cysteinyl-tRNA synthetase
VLFEIVAEGNRRPLPGARGVLVELLPLLGLDSLIDEEEEAPAEALALLEKRETARAGKDFDRADALRDQLAEMGWEVRDEAGGARLVRRR